MIQEIREKVFKFKIGEKIQIDNLNFKIKRLFLDFEEENNSYSIVIWGSDKPNATTISKDRIVRLDNLLWKPRKIDVFTEGGKIISILSKKDEITAFVELQKTDKDKVVSILAEMDTMLNKPHISYAFE